MRASDLPAALRARLGLSAPRSKYYVSSKETRTADGIVFDSKAEMHRYRELELMRANGLVSFFLMQVPFRLPGNVRYFADFMVFYPDGHWEVQDKKGVKTALYILKKKQVKAIYGIEIREV